MSTLENIEFEIEKSKKYYHLKLENEFYKLLPISVEKFDLFFLDCLNRELLEEILHYDSFIRAKEQSYRYLALRDHFEKELLIKLKEKQYSSQICSEILDQLRSEKLLDDYKVACKYANQRLQKEGENKVLSRLLQKGVAKEIAKKAIEESDVDKLKVCRKLLAKKMESLEIKAKIDRKQEIKLVNFLKNKGFNISVIIKLINQIK